MADKKITDLTSLTTADATDVLVIVDVSASTTKKILVSGLAAAIAAALADASVTVKALTNPHKFSAYKSGAQNSGAATFGRVNFEVEEFDTGSNYDNATNFRFTAPISGFYRFSFSVGTAASTSAWLAALYKNGAEFKRGSKQGASGNSESVGTALMQLVAGDYVECWLFSGTNVAIEASQQTAFFQGELVSKA